MATAAFLPPTPIFRPRIPTARHRALPICAAASDAPPPDADTDEGEAPRSGRKDRRRVVRIAWEKLVRWSRSWRSRNRSDVLETTRKVVVLGGGSFGTAMAAQVAVKKPDLEVAMLLRDDLVCRSINDRHVNSWEGFFFGAGGLSGATHPQLRRRLATPAFAPVGEGEDPGEREREGIGRAPPVIPTTLTSRARCQDKWRRSS